MAGVRRLIARVLTEVARGGGRLSFRSTNRRRPTLARLGRGHVAASFSGASLGPRSRRVIIKTRLVRLQALSTGTLATHIRYLARDGITRKGEPAHAYDAQQDQVDLPSFAARGAGDRHQFRLIVAPEDGVQLEDLRDFTRTLMAQVERDLGTRLEWVAVDHWDTDNPHTHVLLRGKDDRGKDLIIARSYIAHGMRYRACELATEWLGERTESELRAAIGRDVEREGWTDLDRELIVRSRDGVIDLRDKPDNVASLQRRTLLLGRLQRLQALGVARERESGCWQLSGSVERVLRTLEERHDIVRTMQRAFTAERRDFVIHDPAATETAPVVGRVAAKGLADELNDRAYIVVDAIDGRAHYVALPAGFDLTALPVGSIVATGAVTEHAADRNISRLAVAGLYRVDHHLARIRAQVDSAEHDPEEVVAAHVRRLEALRRAGVVERLADGVWQVPVDLVQRGRSYDRHRLRDTPIALLSHLPIEGQIRAIGATWLDRQLTGGVGSLSDRGFAAAVRNALSSRQDFLVEQGFAERRGQRVILASNLLATLRDRDIEATAGAIAAQTGLTYRPVHDGGTTSGIYRRSVMLASGRFAMLDDGLGFGLVPWRPVIERRLGQTVSAVVRGEHVTWGLGRGRGLAVA